jgi:hypothetical protein
MHVGRNANPKLATVPLFSERNGRNFAVRDHVGDRLGDNLADASQRRWGG